MYKYYLIILMLLKASVAQSQMIIPLYTKPVNQEKKTDGKEEYFNSESGLPLVKNISNPDITVYLPKNTKSKIPSVIIFPGGGYGVLAYKHEGHDVAKELVKNGIAAMVVKYRLPSEWKGEAAKYIPMQDAFKAIEIVGANATKWQLDTGKIGIMGFSAGGHLAASAGTHYADKKFHQTSLSLRPGFMVLVYPVISFSSIGHAGSRENLIGKAAKEEDIEYFSNELHVNAQTPPTFLVHAADDGAVPVENSTRFKKELEKNAVKTQLFLYEKGGHGFGMINNTEPGRLWLQEAINWIKKL